MMAIIFPGLLMLTLTIVQAGLYYHAKQRAAAAADHGAAAAAIGGGNIDAGERAARAFLADMPLGNSRTPNVNVAIAGDEATVTVVGAIDPIVPIGTWTVAATASAPLEQFIPEGER